MLKSSQIGAQLSPARVFPFGATPVAASSRYVCSKSPQTPQRLKDMTEWQSIEHFQIGCCQLAPPVSASRDVMVFQTAVAILDWSGVIVFAISGALVASRKQMDIVGFVLLGTVTGIGGGTLRDVLLGANPVFWIDAPAYLLACLVVSGIVFFTAHIPQSRYKLLLWFDGLGLGIFAVVGAEKALLMGAGPTVAIAMGVITATFAEFCGIFSGRKARLCSAAKSTSPRPLPAPRLSSPVLPLVCIARSPSSWVCSSVLDCAAPPFSAAGHCRATGLALTSSLRVTEAVPPDYIYVGQHPPRLPRRVSGQCPLWVKSGHSRRKKSCLLYPESGHSSAG
jgi:hypothetical protein